MRDTYTINTDLTWKQYFGLVLYTLARTKAVRVIFSFVTCIALLDAVLTIAAPGKNGVNWPQTLAPILLAPLAIAVFFSGFALLSAWYISAYKAHLIRGFTYTFTHWGMERRGLVTEASIPWRNFTRIKETRNFFLLYVYETKVETFEIIQKEKFPTEAEQAEFKEFIQRNIPPAR